jgi:lipopolysaccharide assembly outer membrane protein LptD (OstA)
LFGSTLVSHAQVTVPSDSLAVKGDSLLIGHDSSAVDTSRIHKKKKDSGFKSKIDYTAKDSLIYSSDYQKAYLYGDAKVKYEDIELTSAYMEYDFVNNKVYAAGVKDSTGADKGLPLFTKGNEKFTSHTLTYNFKTQSGVIHDIVTEQEGGFLHAEKTKRHADGSIDIKNGIYTTCDAPHPHFGLILTKGKVLPNDKIISSFAYMEFEDVPLPLFLPFGFFPNSKKSVSGIIMPSYGNESSRGFYLSNGGYYFALSDYYDLTLTGEVYSKGSWGLGAKSSYIKKYKFSGNFSLNYTINKSGIAGIDSGDNQLLKQKDFSIVWSHQQAATANPSQSFNASVNYSSHSYDKNNNYTNYTALTTSSKTSSINYSKKWNKANLTINLGVNQNSASDNVTFTLPSMAFTLDRIYPFRRKDATTDLKWYENITINYSPQMSNTLSSTEKEVFSKKTLSRAQNGYKHSLPLSTNIKFLKYFNFSPSLNYNGMFYTTQIRKSFTDSLHYTTSSVETVHYVKTDTIHRLSYAQGFSTSFSVSLNPTVYGMLQFDPKSKIIAIRHVLTPSVSFSFIPKIGDFLPTYKRTYIDTAGKKVEYSIYEKNIYGTPSSSSTRSGSFSFSLGNNLEMKVKSAKDTVTGTKKIVLIQSLSFSSGYNLYAESFKLSPISISGNTPIAKGLNINYNGGINPYDLDTTGTAVDVYYWKRHKGIGRLTSAGLSFGYTFQSGAGQKKDEGASKGTDKGPDVKKETPSPKGPSPDFSYFKIPWSFSFNYNLSYSKSGFTKTVVQSLSFNGSMSLTPKWSMTFNSGYDFKAKDFSYTSFSINRNLHCWTMSINFAPFGTYKYYEFRISAVSQFLRDLKYEQRKDYRDYAGYSY